MCTFYANNINRKTFWADGYFKSIWLSIWSGFWHIGALSSRICLSRCDQSSAQGFLGWPHRNRQSAINCWWSDNAAGPDNHQNGTKRGSLANDASTSLHWSLSVFLQRLLTGMRLRTICILFVNHTRMLKKCKRWYSACAVCQSALSSAVCETWKLIAVPGSNWLSKIVVNHLPNLGTFTLCAWSS